MFLNVKYRYFQNQRVVYNYTQYIVLWLARIESYNDAFASRKYPNPVISL